MLVTAGAGAGDAWTVVRAFDGSLAQAHLDNAFVFGFTTAALFDQIWAHFQLLEKLLYKRDSNRNHVALTDNTGGFNDLQVTQDTGTNMKFKVATGHAWIDSEPMGIDLVFTSSTIIAPVGNPRRDLIQGTLAGNTITVKQGTEAASPTTPTVDPGSIELAYIEFGVGHTPLVDADITDLRVF
jgi:hypothetical protein